MLIKCIDTIMHFLSTLLMDTMLFKQSGMRLLYNSSTFLEKIYKTYCETA